MSHNISTSLVKYDPPMLVTKNSEKKYPKAKSLNVVSTVCTDDTIPVISGGPQIKSGITSGIEGQTQVSQQTLEILNSILPPREWTEHGQLWVQKISSVPATRLDVINLQEELDKRLQQQQARETGICPIRRELYSQVFDELIRQVTINCAERGMLLIRVRDEIKMTISAYQSLYESSVAFGMRKSLQSEQEIMDLDKKIDVLEAEKKDLERQINDLIAKADKIEQRAKEQRNNEEKKHVEEIQFLKKTNQQLKAQLDGILNPKLK